MQVAASVHAVQERVDRATACTSFGDGVVVKLKCIVTSTDAVDDCKGIVASDAGSCIAARTVRGTGSTVESGTEEVPVCTRLAGSHSTSSTVGC